nr:hypothetical protein [Sedimentibacter sp.]
MGNEEKLTGKEFEEIKMLVDKATTASNKKTAEPFIKRLDFMRRTLNIEPYKRIVFGELVSYVSTASGQVKDKAHWMGAVNQSLFKLKPSSDDMGDLK